MGNRAVITTPAKDVAIYLHWNGGRDSVEPLLKYCELQGYRPPSKDCYGWARMLQVLGNYFGGTCSVGIDTYRRLRGQGDNGTYIIDGWEIVGREDLYEGFIEQQDHDFNEMLHDFDNAMPEHLRLGEFIDAPEIPVRNVLLGDQVWVREFEDVPKLYQVVGFASGVIAGEALPLPYINRYGEEGEYASNPNNFIKGGTCRVKWR